jgi:polyhydroxyalkanoate synthesis regulator protein
MLTAVTAQNGNLMVPASDPVAIKLYANRRLYRPSSGSYVTLLDLEALVADGATVVVRDATTGSDVTAFILAHPSTEH